MRFGLLIILFSSTVYSQNLHDLILSDLQEYERPKLIEITTLINQNDSIGFNFEDMSVLILSSSFDSAHISISRIGENIPMQELQLSYAIWMNYYNSAYLFDVDGNGFNDILISSFPTGATGIGANIPIITCILNNNNKYQVVTISSFGFDIEDSFFDFDDNQTFEFVCSSAPEHPHHANNDGYYFLKVFSVQESRFVPMVDDKLKIKRMYVVKEDGSAIESFLSVPDSLRRFWDFGPNIWVH